MVLYCNLLQLTLVEGLLLPFLYIHTCGIFNKCIQTLNIQKYKSFKNRNLADQRTAERAHKKEQFGIFSDDLKKSFRVLRKLICKDNGHNMTNSIDFIIDKSIVSDKT